MGFYLEDCQVPGLGESHGVACLGVVTLSKQLVTARD